MKTKFNWDRFYDELEGGNPKKFPFWQFLFHELAFSLDRLVAGVFLGFFILMFVLIAMGNFASYLEKHPDFVMSKICVGYNEK